MMHTVTSYVPAEGQLWCATGDCETGNLGPSVAYWMICSRSRATLEEDELIGGHGARFAAAASRRAMRQMLGKPRDDAEAR
jgi:hypothetical protein